jgi:hypothetical protein
MPETAGHRRCGTYFKIVFSEAIAITLRNGVGLFCGMAVAAEIDDGDKRGDVHEKLLKGNESLVMPFACGASD